MKSFGKSRAIKPFADINREPAELYPENQATRNGESRSSGDGDYTENTFASEAPHFSRYAAVISR